MITWAQIALAFLKLVNWVTGLISQERWKQQGRDEVSGKVNAKTVETQDAIDRVPHPTDDAVDDSLRSGKF